MDNGPETIESRIARWMQTGEGVEDIFREVDDFIVEHEKRFIARYGESIALEALEEVPSRIWDAIGKGLYDPSQRFGPWLRTVIKNRCIDLIREGKRHAIPFAAIQAKGADNADPDLPDVRNDCVHLDRAEMIDQVTAEIEEFLKPENRIIFAIASGLADHLDRQITDRWYAACTPYSDLRGAVDALIDTPIHGRQRKLAEALGLRPATVRKRFERAAETIARHSAMEALRRLVLGDSSPPP